VSKETEELTAEVRAVKKLLILQLLRSGATQSQIAAMLGVSDATMSRMLPKGAAKSAKATGNPKAEAA
jgi:DNA-binding transcriptional regulator LsrR (DeoR family)